MTGGDRPLVQRVTRLAREVVQDGSAVIGLLGHNAREATVKVAVANGRPVRRNLESAGLRVRTEQDGDWAVLHVIEKGTR